MKPAGAPALVRTTGADMTSYRLGINTCFAVKRWPQPDRWARLVRDELRLDLVQHSLDLVDLDAPPAGAADQAARLRAACAGHGLDLHSTFTRPSPASPRTRRTCCCTRTGLPGTVLRTGTGR